MCILRTTTYWGCESTVLRGSFESRGIQCFNVPYKENSRFFPTRETGNLKINMAESDLSPTTFTSSSASDSDCDISLRIPLKMKTKIYALKLQVIIHHQTQKQEATQRLKSAGVRRCQRQSQSRSELDQVVIP